MRRSLLALGVAAATLTACDGFREAMSAHVDVAARAGNQELSVERLSSMLAGTDVPLSTDIGRMVADVWVNYHLLAQAAARGDSLISPQDVETAMWPIIAQARAQRWHQQVMSNLTGLDTTVTEARYARGDLLAAQHILLLVPEGQPQSRDSVRRRAEQLRAQVTTANFAALAERHSQDPGSAPRGGALGVFPRGVMVPAFEQGVASLQPGEISPVVETQFGFHIIRRQPLGEVRDQFAQSLVMMEAQHAESTWVAGLERGYNVQYKPNAVATIRRTVEDPEGNMRSRTVIATSRSGDLTAGRLAQWVAAVPQRDQIRQGVATADDTTVLQLAKSVMRQEMVLHQADSAKVELDSAQMREIQDVYRRAIVNSWQVLGVSPQALADSASTQPDRERLAAQRVERYMDALLANQVQFLDIPGPLQSVLRQKYSWRVPNAGITRTIELAQKRRAEADSAARANRPASAVPIVPQTPPADSQDD